MDFVRAIRIVFEDPQWVSKVAITAIITLLSIVLTPLLIGLAGWAVLLGYQIVLIGNIRARHPQPLPRWDDVSEYFNTGSQALVALVVYMLPLIVFGCCFASLNIFGIEPSGPVMLALLCAAPFLLVYVGLALLLHTLGMGRFVDDPRVGVFFEIGKLLGMLRARGDVTLRYLLNILILGAIYGALNGVPCLGTLVALGIQAPVNGALAGLFASEMLDQKGKRGG